MLQWFISFCEFTEFSESSVPFRKNSIVFNENSVPRSLQRCRGVVSDAWCQRALNVYQCTPSILISLSFRQQLALLLLLSTPKRSTISSGSGWWHFVMPGITLLEDHQIFLTARSDIRKTTDQTHKVCQHTLQIQEGEHIYECII